MALDIREVESCEDCIRNRHATDFGEEGSLAAGDYLTLSASETAKYEDEIDDAVLQGASDFLFNNYGSNVKKSAKGAVGHCGRAIGRGACEGYMFDSETAIIIPKTDF